MSASSKGLRLTVSVKLSSVVGISLVALCVMGMIAVLSAREIQRLGQDLYADNKQLLETEMNISVGIERAIANVQSAPAELNLNILKSKQAELQTLVADAGKMLNHALRGNAPADVKAGGAAVVAAIGKFEDASKKVFDFATSFAQADAMIALSSSVEPAEAAVREALKQFREAAERANVAKSAVIESTTATITWGAAGLPASW
jgi:hypothetical protein